jgi:uncharacterized lipoprotein YmbA
MIPGPLTWLLTRLLTAPWSRSLRASAALGATTHAQHLRAVATVIVCSALFLSACSTGKQTQTRFYVLDSMPASVSALDGATRDPPLAVNIAALRLPQYLARPQIVTRSASNELKLAEYHQWGGNLAKNMMRVTARNLARLLDTAQITIFSRRPPKAPDIRLEIDVLQFERGPDARVLLSAQWRLLATGDGTPKVARISDLYSEPLAADATIDKTVAAMSELMGRLNREIAIAIVADTQ